MQYAAWEIGDRVTEGLQCSYSVRAQIPHGDKYLSGQHLLGKHRLLVQKVGCNCR